MSTGYPYDWFDGRSVPPLVVNRDHCLNGQHQGSVYVESGVFVLTGILMGSLSVEPGASAQISGTQQGSVSIGAGSSVSVTGVIQGSVSVNAGGTLIIEPGRQLGGSLDNDGRVIVRGVFGGALDGTGDLTLEGDGSIKQPVSRGGFNAYEW